MTSDEQPPTGFPEPPGGPEGGRPTPRDPHHALNNPATDPDPTEYPDPYDRRPDPRDPDLADPAAGQQPSTSEPPPPRNREELLDRSEE
jgi:hypothetical protein